MQAKLKAGVGVIVLIVIILALIPVVDGYLFKSNYAARLSEWQATQIRVTLLEYHEGWFSSEAKILIENPSAASGTSNGSASIVLDQHVSHGPIAFNPITNHWGLAQAVIVSKMDLSPAVEAVLLGNQAGQGLLNMVTVAGFDGVYTTQFKVPMINKSIPNLGSISWQGMDGNLIVQASAQKLTRIQSDMNLGAVSAQSPQGTLVTKNVTIKYDFTTDVSGLWNGNYNIAVPQIAVTSPYRNLQVTNFKLSDLFNVTGNNYNNDMQVSIDQFAVPEYSVSQLNLRLTFKNINAAGLYAVVKTATALQGRSLTPEEYEKYSGYIPGLFTASTDVEFDASINSSYGHVVMDGQVSWPAGVKATQDIAMNANAKINIRIAVALVNKLIDALAQKDQPNTENAPASVADTQPSEENLLAQIDALATNGKIEADTSENLKDLVQTHLSAADFAKNVDGFVQRKELTTDLAAQLKLQYNIVLSYKKNPHPVAAVTQPTQVVSPADQMKQQLADYVKAGYITVDKDDYVTTITVEQGVAKANGKVIQQ